MKRVDMADLVRRARVVAEELGEARDGLNASLARTEAELASRFGDAQALVALEEERAGAAVLWRRSLAMRDGRLLVEDEIPHRPERRQAWPLRNASMEIRLRASDALPALLVALAAAASSAA